MRKVILLLILSFNGSSAIALELYGVDLGKSQQGELRSATENAGLKLIQQGGEDQWFDSYDSSDVLPLSRRLYLGFVKQDKRFAFAEYEFAGFDYRQILRNLKQKYGPPKLINGKYISDRKYRWIKDGIEISLQIDWRNYRTRLSYIEPAAFAALRKERPVSTVGVSETDIATDYSIY
ncbi:MAG: hypothetical protein ACC663_12420 [Gammaproteobacteria bacterium]